MTVQRIPPHSKEAEAAIIGAMLTRSDLMPLISETLTADDFYHEKHKALFTALMELHNEGTTIDLITITNKFSEEELKLIGGIDFIASIINNLPGIGSAQIKDYAKIINEAAVKRKFISLFTAMVSESYSNESDITSTLAKAEGSIYSMFIKGDTKDLETVGHDLDSIYEELEKRKTGNSTVNGVPTGFPSLDKRLNALTNANLIIVAARPSMGKSAFMQALAAHAAIKENITSLIFSIEMTKRQIEYRILSAEALINANSLRTGELEDEDFEKLAHLYAFLNDAPLYIDDTASITLSEIRSKCRKIKAEKNLGFICIDYLQRIKPEEKRRSKNEELEDITRGLKELAKELGIPIVLLSQLSRAPEMRADHRPILSDLRESGAIEQDADVVMFLYRDEYYYPETEKKNIAEVIISKHREGATGTVELVWLGQYTKFAEKARFSD